MFTSADGGRGKQINAEAPNKEAAEQQQRLMTDLSFGG